MDRENFGAPFRPLVWEELGSVAHRSPTTIFLVSYGVSSAWWPPMAPHRLCPNTIEGTVQALIITDSTEGTV